MNMKSNFLPVSLILILLTILPNQKVNGQAPNDLCVDATSMVCGDMLSTTTLDATDDNPTNDCQDNGLGGVWYRFAGNGADMTISLNNTAPIDHVFGIYEGSCGTLTCVSSTNAVNGSITTQTDAGEFFYVWVRPFSISSFGLFNIELSCDAPSNSTCASAQELLCEDFLIGSIDGSTDSNPTTSCGDDSGIGVWYSLEGNGGEQTIQVLNLGDSDVEISVYSGFCAAFNCVTSSIDLDPIVFWNTDLGEDYLIWIESFGPVPGPFSITTSCLEPNEDCFMASAIQCGDTLNGDTTFADHNNPSSSCNDFGTPDVWYSFIGTGGDATFSVTNIAGDHILAVYDGSCGAGLNCLDASTAVNPSITVSTVAGTSYYIAVSTFNGTSVGEFEFTATCVSPYTNEVCTDAQIISCGQTLSSSTIAAQLEPLTAASCDKGVGDDLWYQFIGTGEDITFELDNALAVNSNSLTIYSGTCSSETCIQTSYDEDPVVNVSPSVAGTTYLIQIENIWDASDFDFTVYCSPSTPPNDLCINTENIGCGETLFGTTFSATDDNSTGTCNDTNVPGVWYSFAGNGATQNISVQNVGGSDNLISVYSGSCSSLVCVDSFSGINPSLDVSTSLLTTYYVWVRGWSSSTLGDFEITLTCPSPSSNIQLRAWLEGFNDGATMRTDLYSSGLFPLSQPYFISPFNYWGTENWSCISAQMVDWVFAELRDPANINTVVAQKALVLGYDGFLYDPDICSASIDFGISGSYFIVLNHRNHLGVVSANPIDISAGLEYDFTSAAAQVQGTGQMTQLSNGKWAMLAGDFDANGFMNILDFQTWFLDNTAVSVYAPQDADGTGIVNVLDFVLWFGNSSTVGVPAVQY